MQYRPSIYSASKIWHAEKWIEMRDKENFNIISHWINVPCGTKENPTGAKNSPFLRNEYYGANVLKR